MERGYLDKYRTSKMTGESLIPPRRAASSSQVLSSQQKAAVSTTRFKNIVKKDEPANLSVEKPLRSASSSARLKPEDKSVCPRPKEGVASRRPASAILVSRRKPAADRGERAKAEGRLIDSGQKPTSQAHADSTLAPQRDRPRPPVFGRKPSAGNERETAQRAGGAKIADGGITLKKQIGPRIPVPKKAVDSETLASALSHPRLHQDVSRRGTKFEPVRGVSAASKAIGLGSGKRLGAMAKKQSASKVGTDAGRMLKTSQDRRTARPTLATRPTRRHIGVGTQRVTGEAEKACSELEIVGTRLMIHPCVGPEDEAAMPRTSAKQVDTDVENSSGLVNLPEVPTAAEETREEEVVLARSPMAQSRIAALGRKRSPMINAAGMGESVKVDSAAAEPLLPSEAKNQENENPTMDKAGEGEHDCAQCSTEVAAEDDDRSPVSTFVGSANRRGTPRKTSRAGAAAKKRVPNEGEAIQKGTSGSRTQSEEKKVVVMSQEGAVTCETESTIQQQVSVSRAISGSPHEAGVAPSGKESVRPARKARTPMSPESAKMDEANAVSKSSTDETGDEGERALADTPRRRQTRRATRNIAATSYEATSRSEDATTRETRSKGPVAASDEMSCDPEASKMNDEEKHVAAEEQGHKMNDEEKHVAAEELESGCEKEQTTIATRTASKPGAGRRRYMTRARSRGAGANESSCESSAISVVQVSPELTVVPEAERCEKSENANGTETQGLKSRRSRNETRKQKLTKSSSNEDAIQEDDGDNTEKSPPKKTERSEKAIPNKSRQESRQQKQNASDIEETTCERPRTRGRSRNKTTSRSNRQKSETHPESTEMACPPQPELVVRYKLQTPQFGHDWMTTEGEEVDSKDRDMFGGDEEQDKVSSSHVPVVDGEEPPPTDKKLDPSQEESRRNSPDRGGLRNSLMGIATGVAGWLGFRESGGGLRRSDAEYSVTPADNVLEDEGTTVTNEWGVLTQQVEAEQTSASGVQGRRRVKLATRSNAGGERGNNGEETVDVVSGTAAVETSREEEENSNVNHKQQLSGKHLGEGLEGENPVSKGLAASRAQPEDNPSRQSLANTSSTPQLGHHRDSITSNCSSCSTGDRGVETKGLVDNKPYYAINHELFSDNGYWKEQNLRKLCQRLGVPSEGSRDEVVHRLHVWNRDERALRKLFPQPGEQRTEPTFDGASEAGDNRRAICNFNSIPLGKRLLQRSYLNPLKRLPAELRAKPILVRRDAARPPEHLAVAAPPTDTPRPKGVAFSPNADEMPTTTAAKAHGAAAPLATPPRGGAGETTELTDTVSCSTPHPKRRGRHKPTLVFSPYNQVITFDLRREERVEKRKRIQDIASSVHHTQNPTEELENDEKWRQARRNLFENCYRIKNLDPDPLSAGVACGGRRYANNEPLLSPSASAWELDALYFDGFGESFGFEGGDDERAISSFETSSIGTPPGLACDPDYWDGGSGYIIPSGCPSRPSLQSHGGFVTLRSPPRLTPPRLTQPQCVVNAPTPPRGMTRDSEGHTVGAYDVEDSGEMVNHRRCEIPTNMRSEHQTHHTAAASQHNSSSPTAGMSTTTENSVSSFQGMLLRGGEALLAPTPPRGLPRRNVAALDDVESSPSKFDSGELDPVLMM